MENTQTSQVKVHYDPDTTLVIGYYPDLINYGLIPDPYIEISEKEHLEAFGKQMSVVDGIFQEYILPMAQQIIDAKNVKINQLNQNRSDFCLIPIEYNGNTYATTLEAKNAINFYIASLSTLASVGDYYTLTGEKVSLTKADFKALAALIQIREIESRDKREILLTEINTCTTIEEINAINIDF
jgi:hypothetical protein